jgi:putative phosphonate catabolism associated alcohol dehydrogenase
MDDLHRPLPSHARVAVHDVPGGPFRLATYPLRPPAAGEALVRVRMSTICRSDIHSYQGHRPSPCPGLLGHEIVGTVVALGEALRRDMRDEPLAVGDRVTWSEYAVPARGYLREVLDLPHKAPGLLKYGHLSSETPPHHHGGFGEYCYVLPDSWILKLPDAISDAEATPINCGVATMCAVIEAAEVGLGQTVVVVGLGLLGLYGAALAKARGAARVIGIDAVPARRALAGRFGVDAALAPGEAPPVGAGADAVIEVCGDPSTIADALGWLRPGGRIVVAGTVNPGAMVTLDANAILRACATLVGVHNYHPRHLLQALAFVVGHRDRYPLGELVDARYPLSAVGEAMADAAARRVLRAAIVPDAGVAG